MFQLKVICIECLGVVLHFLYLQRVKLLKTNCIQPHFQSAVDTVYQGRSKERRLMISVQFLIHPGPSYSCPVAHKDLTFDKDSWSNKEVMGSQGSCLPMWREGWPELLLLRLLEANNSSRCQNTQLHNSQGGHTDPCPVLKEPTMGVWESELNF